MRTEIKHTPGLWRVVKPLHGHKTTLRCVQIGKDENYTTLELKPEDARLIAAAPYLLEACRKAERGLVELAAALGMAGDRTEYDDATGALIAVQSAIAKAETR